jgi:RNA polymerase sigma-70 factor (ECF subfamily)
MECTIFEVLMRCIVDNWRSSSLSCEFLSWYCFWIRRGSMRQRMQEAFKRCQKRYPNVGLPFDAFHDRILNILLQELKLKGEKERIAAFNRLHHQDLFLAIACSRDDHVAWEHFAEDYLPLLKRFAAQALRIKGESEDLAQGIISRMLMEKGPLTGYNGRGSLAGWLRVIVARAAIDRYRRAQRHVSLEQLQEKGGNLALASDSRQDEIEDLDSRWGPVISQIVNDAISRLSGRDRLLLSLYYFQKVPLKMMARQFRIHEATASRWLESLRKGIRKQVEGELKKSHGMRTSEIRSLWKWISLASITSTLVEGMPPTAGMKTGDTLDEMKKNAARRSR